MTVVNASVQPGEGTVLQVTIATVLTPVAQCYEIDGPEQLVEAIDKTALNSGLIITRPSKFPEPGKLSIKIWYDPNDNVAQGLFVADITAPGTVEAFVIVVNDQHVTHSTIGFSGFLTSFKPTGMKPKSSNLSAEIEIQLTTILTIVAGSS